MIIVNGSNVTIKDSAGNGTIRSAGTALGVINDGSAIVESGDIVSTGNTAVWAGGKNQTGHVTFNGGSVTAQEFAIAVGKDSSITIEDGTFTANDNGVIGGNGSAGYENATITINGGNFNGHIQTAGYTGCGIYMPNSGKVDVNGGKFTIDGVGICARAGQVTIDGGEFISTVATEGWVGDKKNQISANGIFYDGAAKYPSLDATASVTITGGTFTNTADASIPAVKVTQPDNGIEIAVNAGDWSIGE